MEDFPFLAILHLMMPMRNKTIKKVTNGKYMESNTVKPLLYRL